VQSLHGVGRGLVGEEAVHSKPAAGSDSRSKGSIRCVGVVHQYLLNHYVISTTGSHRERADEPEMGQPHKRSLAGWGEAAFAARTWLGAVPEGT
jgi:hypothetical protein